VLSFTVFHVPSRKTAIRFFEGTAGIGNSDIGMVHRRVSEKSLE
jgi:hypothetical protein